MSDDVDKINDKLGQLAVGIATLTVQGENNEKSLKNITTEFKQMVLTDQLRVANLNELTTRVAVLEVWKKYEEKLKTAKETNDNKSFRKKGLYVTIIGILMSANIAMLIYILSNIKKAVI